MFNHYLIHIKKVIELAEDNLKVVHKYKSCYKKNHESSKVVDCRAVSFCKAVKNHDL